MNVVVEPKPNCVATLRVELEPERVKKEWSAVARDFQKRARIPGFRPGKAPQAIVDKKFAAEIQDEVTNRLLRESISEAADRENLKILSVSKVDEVEITEDKSMRFAATLITSPEFELPDYGKIELAVSRAAVTDADVEKMLESLAEQHAEFEPVDGRALAMGDFAIVTYEGTLDGTPLLDAVKDCPPLLAGRPNWWVRMAENTLAPGFCEALAGLEPGAQKSFELDLPGDFPFTPLAARRVAYSATLHEIRERKLPPLDDALAEKIQPGQTIAALRDSARSMLERQADVEFERAKRDGAVRHLLGQVTYEIPAHMVNSEMTGILRDIVQENQVRGVSDEELRAHQDQILGAAKQSAAERVRTSFLLLRIAEKEKLDVSEHDLALHITEMSQRYEIPAKKLIADLKRRNAFPRIREQILAAKALDFIVSNVTVRDPQAAE